MSGSTIPATPRRTALLAGLATVAPLAVVANDAVGAISATGRVALLGDSILDNSAYVDGGPDVAAQLADTLPDGWQVTLAAVDGAVTVDVPDQLAGVPGDTTHQVVSVGGNDALRAEGLLDAPARSVGEALLFLADIREAFAAGYRAMLDTVLATGRPTAVCTIYDPRFPDLVRRRAGIAGVALFNDVILREAAARSLPVIDLRLVCAEDADFANPIEPSVQGGAKIAAAITQLVADGFGGGRAVIVGRAG